MVGNGAVLKGGPPSKPPVPTLKHGLVSLKGWVFLFMVKCGGMEPLGEKSPFGEFSFQIFQKK